MCAVSQKGGALKYASVELRQDKEVVLTAVQRYGYALQHASEQLQGDKDVVMLAVMQNGEALQFASEALQGDKDVVLEAVAEKGDALYYSSIGLKYGGLKAYIDELMATHETFYFALHGMTTPRQPLTPTPDSLTEDDDVGKRSRKSKTVLRGLEMVNRHGIHNAYLIKVLIADYVGCPRGHHWTTVSTAAHNLGMF